MSFHIKHVQNVQNKLKYPKPAPVSTLIRADIFHLHDPDDP